MIHCPADAVSAGCVVFSHLYAVGFRDHSLVVMHAWPATVSLIVNLRNIAAAGSCCCLLMHLKELIFRGNALIYIKGAVYFSLGLLFHHRAPLSLPRPPPSSTPRYIFHVLKNSIAPSPIVQARHLDRLEPYTRSQWIKEWRSLRGGGTVTRSRLSTPPSPTLDTPADIAYFPPASPVTSDSMMSEYALNVITENSKAEAQRRL